MIPAAVLIETIALNGADAETAVAAHAPNAKPLKALAADSDYQSWWLEEEAGEVWCHDRHRRPAAPASSSRTPYATARRGSCSAWAAAPAPTETPAWSRPSAWLAAEHASALERWARDTGVAQVSPARYVVSLVAASRGETDTARALATEGVRLAEEQGDLTFAAQCRFVLGQLELSVDDAASALRWIEPLAAPFREYGHVEPGLYPFRPDLIEAYAQVGRIMEATAELRRLQADAARLDHPWARITAGRAASVVHLAQRDPASALDSADKAVAECRGRTLPLELGRCLLVLGTAQRRARQRREAAVSLDEAIAVLHDLGARTWEALAHGQRDRLVHLAQDTLTPAERRVAELVAQGLSNAEIAAAMLISVKTVEANLTRIYRKLGLRGRAELIRNGARRAAGPGEAG